MVASPVVDDAINTHPSGWADFNAVLSLLRSQKSQRLAGVIPIKSSDYTGDYSKFWQLKSILSTRFFPCSPLYRHPSALAVKKNWTITMSPFIYGIYDATSINSILTGGIKNSWCLDCTRSATAWRPKSVTYDSLAVWTPNFGAVRPSLWLVRNGILLRE